MCSFLRPDLVIPDIENDSFLVKTFFIVSRITDGVEKDASGSKTLA